MKAVRIHSYGGPDQLRFEEDVPDPVIGPDQVLIETSAASVNPIDWKVRSGARQKDFPLTLPAILGKDVSGVVVAVGREVRTVKPGDRVVAMADATYAQFVAVLADAVTRLPDGADIVEAAAIPLVSLTGDQLVRSATGVTAGQTILVSGALGSVGRAAVHAASKLGARVIAGVRGRQLSEAAALNVASTVAIDDDEALAALAPLDGVADTVGGETGAKLLARVREGGRFGYASVLPADAVNAAGVEIARVFAHPDPVALEGFVEDFVAGSFVLPISRHMPLRDAGDAQALLERGGGGKIVLTV